jgi:predicted transcriptional regulator
MTRPRLLTEEQLRHTLRAKVTGTSQGEFAKMVGLSQQYVSMMLRGQRPIPRRVLAELGVKKVVRYEKW